MPLIAAGVTVAPVTVPTAPEAAVQITGTVNAVGEVTVAWNELLIAGFVALVTPLNVPAVTPARVMVSPVFRP